jgi:hypothetical protein
MLYLSASHHQYKVYNNLNRWYVHYWPLTSWTLIIFWYISMYLPCIIFQWDGSRFPRSCEEKPEASTAVLSIV